MSKTKTLSEQQVINIGVSVFNEILIFYSTIQDAQNQQHLDFSFNIASH